MFGNATFLQGMQPPVIQTQEPADLSNRAALVDRAVSEKWDVLVVGGGATGLGCAVDAASRGLRTLLIDRLDFAKGTSSRSTQLVHGGLRYLRRLHLGVVREGLAERQFMMHAAPHLVGRLGMIIPVFSRWQSLYYGTGLRLYDLLAGRKGIGRSQHLSRDETAAALPGLSPARLHGGLRYFDGQFDDARYAITLVRTLADLGGAPLNYMRAVDLIRESGRIRGVVAEDTESGGEFRLNARCVINATGPFANNLHLMAETGGQPLIQASRGVHLLLDRSFLGGSDALVIPATPDGRILFAAPWHDRLLIGTTDVPVSDAAPEPAPSDEEVDFLLETAGEYFQRRPQRSDVLAAYAGLRPLRTSRLGLRDTADIPRSHLVRVSDSGMVSVVGGKWTTYRRMGEDAVDAAVSTASISAEASRTRELRLHGYLAAADGATVEDGLGTDLQEFRALTASDPSLAEPVHERLPYSAAWVVWAARREMARSVEDVLARRTRSLLLDARAAIEAAPAVAALLARELGRDEAWAQNQVHEFTEMASAYVVN